jgi:hypothetical protein
MTSPEPKTDADKGDIFTLYGDPFTDHGVYLKNHEPTRDTRRYSLF